MMVMVVVIICLLNHYKLSSWSLMSRLGQARRQEHSLQPVRPQRAIPHFQLKSVNYCQP